MHTCSWTFHIMICMYVHVHVCAIYCTLHTYMYMLQVESKLRSAETRFEEEKLMIQKTQEESIKKVKSGFAVCSTGRMASLPIHPVLQKRVAWFLRLIFLYVHLLLVATGS